MKRNISLILGIIIGVLAASSLVQSYGSVFGEILNVFTAPIHVKYEILELPKHQEGVESNILDVQHSDVRQYDHLSAKFHINCFKK